MAILISLSGLSGVGKTTLARALSEKIGAIHLRVDSVETALKRSSLKIDQAEDAGYLAIASVAKDNLLLGHNVVVDTVNPLEITRNLWSRTAAASDAHLFNMEVTCSDRALHRKRVLSRKSDIEGHVVPTWSEVTERAYDPWNEERLVVDTSSESTKEAVEKIAIALEEVGQMPQ